MALAFGVASGAGPIADLYGAVYVGFFAVLFGGTPTLISEPTGTMTVLMPATIAGITAMNPNHGLAMAFTVVMYKVADSFATSSGYQAGTNPTVSDDYFLPEAGETVLSTTLAEIKQRA